MVGQFWGAFFFVQSLQNKDEDIADFSTRHL
jgi:hypothetical protein